jgi:hypothetical protein
MDGALATSMEVGMEVSEAVKEALGYVREAFSEEGISQVGLEEVEHDEYNDVWRVTVGFARPWDLTVSAAQKFMPALGAIEPQARSRTYKVVVLNANGSYAIKNRDV